MNDIDSSPLRNYPIYVGTDTDETRQVLSRLFTEARIELFSKWLKFDTEINGLELARSTISFLDQSSGLRACTIAPMDCHTIQCPLTGGVEFEIDGQVTIADDRYGGIISEEKPIKVTVMPGTRLLCFNVKNNVLRDVSTAITGRWDLPNIRFEPQFDLARPQAISLVAQLKTFTTELDRQGGLVEAPAAVASIEHALIMLMLYGLKNSLSDEIHKPGRNAGLHKVQLVEEYMSANAEQPIDMQTIARITGHSVNSIFRAFQRYRDYTPMQFLRSVRLDRVRQHLLLSQTKVSVTNVAIEYGFTHLGRFSLAYKRRFDESPSDTVRRVINR